MEGAVVAHHRILCLQFWIGEHICGRGILCYLIVKTNNLLIHT